MLEKLKNIFKKDNFGGGYSVSGMFSGRELGDSGISYLNAYKLNLYINKAINVRARKIGQIQFYFYDPKKDEVINDHEVLDLLYKPNKIHSKTEFWELFQKSKDVHGSAYIWLQGARKDPFEKLKKIERMFVLPGNQVKALYNEETNEIEMYEYNKGNVKKELIAPQDIIASHHIDLGSMTKGVSIMQAGIREIKTGSQLTDYQAKILQNGGKIDGVFNFKNQERLKKEQLEEIKARYKEEYAEATKSGMPIFMAGEADYKRVSLAPEELNYLESRKANLSDISKMTGVPKTLMGDFDEIKFDNADASYSIFLRETIKPEIDNIVDKLNENVYLVPKELELMAVEIVPEDLDRILKKNDNGIKNYYLTPNEARQNVGLEPIEGGDELYIPMGIVPVSYGREREDRQGEEEKKEKKFRDVFIHPLKDKGIRELYSKMYSKRLERRQRVFKAELLRYFKDQEKRMLEQLTTIKRFRKKDIIDDIFNSPLEIKIASEAILPVLTTLLKQSATDATELMQYDYNFNLTGQIRGWLDQKANIFAEQINETTFKKLKREFEISLANSETRDQLSKRIKNTYGEISKARADVIARTETHAVGQKGQFEAYSQMNVPIKIWVWSPGVKGGMRDDHMAMDGEERPLNTPFSNGQNMPGEGPAEDVINCECSL